jgi:hypothetical protein
MRLVAVMPSHDPEGIVLPHLFRSTPQLERIFDLTIVRITTATQDAQRTNVDLIKSERAFWVIRNQPGTPVGEQFRALYAHAAETCDPEQILHLCFPDRVAFALQGKYREQFIADVRSVTDADVPLLFQRSERAWDTHPENYRQVEGIATRVGELLLGRSLDWTWCHLVVKAQQLKDVLPQIRRQDLTVLGEILLELGESVNTQDVDWLAWEDPFIWGRGAEELKSEMENSVSETNKRLSYVIPTLQLLAGSVQNQIEKE